MKIMVLLTLILGGAEGTLFELTGIYANIAAIASVENNSNYNIPSRFSPPVLLKDTLAVNNRIQLSPGAAWITMESLLEVARPGDESYWQQFASSQKIAWKTGTSYGLRDAWAIGSTPLFTVGVWAGNASGEGNTALTGVSIAAPVMFDIFNFLKKSEWFIKPSLDMKTVLLCKKSGFLAKDICETQAIDINKAAITNSSFILFSFEPDFIYATFFNTTKALNHLHVRQLQCVFLPVVYRKYYGCVLLQYPEL